MISGTEYVIIAIVLFLVFGPERLPEVSRRIGGWLREARRVADDLRTVLEHEAGQITDPLREITDEARRLRDEGRAAFEWTGPVHDQGPRPEDSLRDLAAIEDGTVPDDDGNDTEESSDGPG